MDPQGSVLPRGLVAPSDTVLYHLVTSVQFMYKQPLIARGIYICRSLFSTIGKDKVGSGLSVPRLHLSDITKSDMDSTNATLVWTPRCTDTKTTRALPQLHFAQSAYFYSKYDHHVGVP